MADSSKGAPKIPALQQGQSVDPWANSPGPLPPIPGAIQQIPVIPYEEPYNPFEGQYYIGPNGEKIPRTPTNSSVRTGP